MHMTYRQAQSVLIGIAAFEAGGGVLDRDGTQRKAFAEAVVAAGEPAAIQAARAAVASRGLTYPDEARRIGARDALARNDAADVQRLTGLSVPL